MLGVSWATLRAGLILDDNLPSEIEGRDLVLVGSVVDIPRQAEFGVRFLFDVEQALLDDKSVSVLRRVLLSSAFKDFTLRAGERWRLRARLTRPHGLQNPGGFDYEAHLFRERVRARGYVRAELTPQRLDGESPRYTIDRIRQRLGERIAALLPESSTLGFVVALANGDERRVEESQWQTLRATGTIHLVAISGLHISLIGGIVFFLARFLWTLPGVTVQWCPAPVVAAVMAILAAAAYAGLAGFVVPTQRALIMLAVAMSGVLLRRRFTTVQLLSLALLFVLLYDPLSVMAPGFWLSFGAVSIILFAASADDNSLWRRFGYIQLAVALGMLPLLIAWFGQVSLVSPIANAIAIPAFDMVAVPLTLLGIVTLPLSADIAALFFKLAALVLEWLWPVLEWLGSSPYAQWSQHTPPVWALICASIGVASLLAPRGWPARWIGLVWLLPLFLVKPPIPAAGEMWFTLLDVGQGLSAVVRTREHTLIFDTGPRFSAAFDTGEAVVAPYLRTQNIRDIDMLVISHSDNDHRGGAESVLRALKVRRVLSSEPEPDLPIAADVCLRGMHWRWDDVEFEIVHPTTEPLGKLNNRSCVLRVRSRYGSVLLPGDIEKRGEKYLLTQQEELSANVLVAPHHGSKTSSHEAFIEAVYPTHVVFPVGYRNRFHHPHPTVVDRYKESGARLWDSASGGALEFRFDASGIHGAAYREGHKRYWFTPTSAPETD